MKIAGIIAEYNPFHGGPRLPDRADPQSRRFPYRSRDERELCAAW